MRAQAPSKYKPYEMSVAASRQMWLAGLGAAAVSREWIQTEAGNTFKVLVKEGSVVESRALRAIGGRVETSVRRANALWKETRLSVESTVRQMADNAVLLVKQTVPRNLPVIAPTIKVAPKSPAKRAIKRTAKAKRTAKRVAR